MAATVSSPWGKPGAWALDAEEHEDELRQQVESPKNSGEAEFPSLAAAAAAKQPKKKKNQTLSLAEFSNFSAAKPSQPFKPSRGLTHDDIVNLPTGPRQRSAEELERARSGGGGFKSYMSNRGGGDDSSNSRWGGEGGNSRVSNRDRDSSREIAPSRADEIDDWSKGKKSPVGNGYERRERGSFFDSQSKADESDSWVSNKPTETRRFGSGNSGFEKRGSFDSLSRDRYGSSGGGGGGGAVDSDSWGRKREESSNDTGIARPKLVLQPRSVPVSNDNGTGAKPKGSSPFGDARPREAVLAEKGKDWKEIDEKLDSSKINDNKETVKGENGRAWSFGNGRGGGGPRSDPVERSWRKPDVAAADTESRPERAERVENGDNSENSHVTEDEATEGN